MDVKIACPCPQRAGQTRHPDGDTVTLRQTLDFRSVTAMRHAIGMLEDDDSPLHGGEILAILTEGYIIYGIESWSLVDSRGQAVPVTREAIRSHILSDMATAQDVGDAADALYGETVLLPLLVRASTSSQPTPMEPSTSPSTGSRKSRPKPSKPSSITTTRTDATEATTASLDGDSNYSQSSVTAA